jgi:cytochrome P450
MGDRHCIGQHFALLEAKTLLAQTYARYRFVLENPDKHIGPCVG